VAEILVKDLWIELGEFSLKGVTVHVLDGDYYVVFGPSGAGKTILIEAIAGIWKPDRGRIFIDGKDVTEEPPEKRGVSIVYQDLMLFPTMNVYDNIAFGLRVKKVPEEEIRKRVLEVAEMLEIENLLERDPKTLSGGEKQRVALARALAIEPKAVLLDEPTASIDVNMRREIRRILRKLNEAGTTIVHVTHFVEELMSLANRVAILKEGRLLYEGPLGEEMFSKEEVARLIGAHNVFKGTYLGGEPPKVKVGDLVFYVNFKADPGSTVTFTVPPESVVLSKEKIESSMRNCVLGEIYDYEVKGNRVDVYVDCGEKIVSEITFSSWKQMNLRVGEKVYVYFKASSARQLS